MAFCLPHSKIPCTAIQLRTLPPNDSSCQIRVWKFKLLEVRSDSSGVIYHLHLIFVCRRFNFAFNFYSSPAVNCRSSKYLGPVYVNLTMGKKRCSSLSATVKLGDKPNVDVSKPEKTTSKVTFLRSECMINQFASFINTSLFFSYEYILFILSI